MVRALRIRRVVAAPLVRMLHVDMTLENVWCGESPAEQQRLIDVDADVSLAAKPIESRV